MSDRDIRIALETRLATGIATLPTSWDNSETDPPDTDPRTPMQAVSLLRAANENPTLGEETTIHRGIFQILLRYPQNETAGAAEERAEVIAAHFPAGLELFSGTIMVRTRGKPSIATGYRAGERWVVPVSVRYTSIF